MIFTVLCYSSVAKQVKIGDVAVTAMWWTVLVSFLWCLQMQTNLANAVKIVVEHSTRTIGYVSRFHFFSGWHNSL